MIYRSLHQFPIVYRSPTNTPFLECPSRLGWETISPILTILLSRGQEFGHFSKESVLQEFYFFALVKEMAFFGLRTRNQQL